MELQHRVRIKALGGYLSQIELQQLLERQFNTLNKPWNRGWGFTASEGAPLPPHVLFAQRNDARTFVDTLSSLYDVVLQEPLYVVSPVPSDAVWTEELANDLIVQLNHRLTGAGFASPVIVGGVAKLGYSLNDLDLLMKPARPMTMEDAIEAIEQLQPQISNDKSLTPMECSDHENVWFMNMALLPDSAGVERVVEFYMDEADFPFEEALEPKHAPGGAGLIEHT